MKEIGIGDAIMQFFHVCLNLGFSCTARDHSSVEREQTEETNRTEISQMDGGEQGTRDMMWAHPRGQKHCDRMRESLAPIEDDIWELIAS